MRENPTFNIVEVDTMSATCRLTLYLMLAVSQTKLHACYWLTVIQLPYRVTHGPGTKWRRNIAENSNCLSRVHERYRRQTDRRQMDGRRHIAIHVR